MRSDMKHVVIDVPRHGGGPAIYAPRTPRARGEEHEGFPLREGMRRRWKDRKELSDRLNPLYRYLDKQVGRPWDAVWSEMCQHLDFRSVQGFHVKGHIDHHVQRHVVLRDGVPYVLNRWGDTVVVHGLYVHPTTGLVCRHEDRTRRTAYRSHFQRQVDAGLVKVIDEWHQLHRLNGGWFIITLARRVDGVACVDVLDTPVLEVAQRWKYGVRFDYPPRAAYGRNDVYAAAKRQISRREKKRYGVSG